MLRSLRGWAEQPAIQQRSGVKRLGGPLIRHTYGHNMAHQGASISEIQTSWGHESDKMARHHPKSDRSTSAPREVGWSTWADFEFSGSATRIRTWNLPVTAGRSTVELSRIGTLRGAPRL